MLDPTIGGKDREDAEKSEAEGKSQVHSIEAANPSGVELQRRAYRAQLVSQEQKSQEAYEKAVLALSGGALGLSLVVVKDLRLQGGGGVGLVVLALLCWALSVSFILFSLMSSRKALRSAIGRVDRGVSSARLGEPSDRVAWGLSTGSGVLFLVGVGFFVGYLAIEPGAGVRQQPVSTAPEEVARFLSLYDTIREACPDCSTVEARKVLQVCEGSYIVPDVLREACPRCTEKGILQLDRRCMEKWNGTHINR
jgi:hypothetical protein